MGAMHLTQSRKRSRSNLAWTWLARLLLPLPAIGILAAATPRMVSGVALEAAFPATVYMEIDEPLTQADYHKTAWILSQAASADGETQIARAEAEDEAAVPSSQIIPIVQATLAHAPGSARGWILFSKLLANGDPKRAAAALTLAIELAPREYFLVGRSAIAGAALWNYLSQDVRDRLLDDARLMIDDKRLRPQLLDLLNSPSGRTLVSLALVNEPDKLRELNRRLARERLNLR